VGSSKRRRAATGLNPVVLATFVVWTGGVGVGTVVLRQREEKARQLLADAKIDVSDIPDGSWGKIKAICDENGINYNN